jgi:hypothetical protein
MSQQRKAICQISGKVRYRERRDVKFALRRADEHRSRARMNEVACSSRETSSYSCPDCDGWHLTSQQAQPDRFIPVASNTAHIPGPAANAILRMAARTGLTVGIAA